MDSQQALIRIPQALKTGFPSRLRLEQTSFFISTTPIIRSNKRAASAVSYAEIDEDFDEDDDEEDLGFRRRSTRSSMNHNGGGAAAQTDEEEEKKVAKPEVKTPLPPASAIMRRVLNYNDVQLRQVAEDEEVLVPIRLNLEYESFRITDCFLWNLNEKVLTPEMFALSLCYDLDLPVPNPNLMMGGAGGPSFGSDSYVAQIAGAIKSQLAEFKTLADIKLPQEQGFNVVISLNVNLNKQVYEDKFEWDLGNGAKSSCYIKDKKKNSNSSNTQALKTENNSTNSTPSDDDNTQKDEPETDESKGSDEEKKEDDKEESTFNGPGLTPIEFAKTIVTDLGFPNEFFPAIAHALYESLYRIKRDALEGHLPPQDVENYAAFNKEAGWRIDQEMLGEEWAPTLETLSQEEIEKREIERERNIRRLKRESLRMGGVILGGDGFSTPDGSKRRRTRGESPLY